MTSPLVVAGHSHIGALAPPPVAEKSKDAGSVAIDAPTLVAVDGKDCAVLTGPMPRDDAYWNALEDATRAAIPAILWQGNQHVTAFLLEPVPPFDFVLAGAPDLPMDPRASYVAEAHLRAFFAPSIEPLGALIARLARASGGPVLVGGTPPPLGNVEDMRARIITDPHFTALAETNGLDLATTAITSPYTLQKLWSLLQTMVAETTASAGAVFVAVPDRIRGGDGFMMPAYAGEGLEANAAYGREMLVELTQAAGALPPRTSR